MSARMTMASHTETDLAGLYERYRRQVLAHITRLVSDPETAEDLLQETFIKALRSWGTRDPQASALAWLYRIATNSAYDHLRRRRRLAFLPLIEQADHGALQVDLSPSPLDEREPVLKALAQIPAPYRIPLVWHAMEGRSTAEIALRLGVTSGAVKTRLFRARERFRQVYQG